MNLFCESALLSENIIDIKKYIVTSLKVSKLLNVMINDLLDYSLIEKGLLKLDLSLFNIECTI